MRTDVSLRCVLRVAVYTLLSIYTLILLKVYATLQTIIIFTLVLLKVKVCATLMAIIVHSLTLFILNVCVTSFARVTDAAGLLRHGATHLGKAT